MKDSDDKASIHPIDGKDEVGRLITFAGRFADRQSEGDSEGKSKASAAAFAQAEHAWQVAVQTHKRHKRRSVWKGLAMVASVALAVLGGRLLLTEQDVMPAKHESAASVLSATGGYQLTQINGVSHRVSAHTQPVEGARIQPGSLLASGVNAFVAVEMANEALIYARPASEFTLHKDGSIWLHSGRIYVDASLGSAHVTVVTKHSRVIDIGTEYEVTVDAQSTEVRLREGSVEVITAAARHISRSEPGQGEVVTIGSDGGIASVRSISSDDPSWDWRYRAMAPFVVEGSTVAELATWVARVEGLQLRFESSRIRFDAQNNSLSGPLISAQSALRHGRATITALSGLELVFERPKGMLLRAKNGE